MPWSPTLGHALDPAAYSGDSSGDREIDFNIYNLSSLIIPLFLLYYYFIHYTLARIEHLSPKIVDNSQYFTVYVSLKPGEEY